ncbi:META domain-containing protein [Jannaschia sp. W003]|uniref:META domain-containing protein n=1 Tax=Jannaschia sp. W003 TaxID=2867012 RepID=UPI0021A54F8D|nr:META domain-containing protein [Jannaschia sp. W003]UWQ21274.1 META domain-containing protein [Jannaschia sp. W003]
MRVLAVLLVVAACGPDETISGYSDREAVWALESIGGDPVPPGATIRFPAEGEAVGEGPCNAFRAEQTAPYPWIELGPVAATRRACPLLAVETRYFGALERATLAEASDRVLILSGGPDGELVFRRTDP